MAFWRRRLLPLVACISLLVTLWNRESRVVYAADSCTASVAPSSVVANAQATFDFSITNTGTTSITYIAIYSPSENFSIINSGVSGWSMSSNASFAEIYDGTIAVGDTLNFNINASVGSQEAASADWWIGTSGGSLVACTGGPFGTAITGTADVTAPSISSPSVTNVTSSEATVSWTTDELSETQLDYGITPNYGTVKHDTVLKTSHSVMLTGLSPNTTYYYALTSRDESGNITYYPDNSFTTASLGFVAGTPAPSSVPTATPGPSPTPTPTPTPSIERVPPTVTITSEFNEPFSEAPTIEGRATDNVGVVRIDYSTDGGVNWLPVDDAPDLGSTATDFSFVPFIFDDGNYEIVVRAIDAAENTGTSETLTLVLDRLPPRVGGVLLSLGPQPLQPDENGIFTSLTGLPVGVTASSVGGATSIDISAGKEIFALTRVAETGLWKGEINIATPGLYEISTKAVDGAGNTTQRTLGRILIVEPGLITSDKRQLIKGAEITVYVQDKLTKLWNVWDGQTFGQVNPQKIERGTYQFFLPPGKYYLQVKAKGYQKLISVIFDFDKSAPLNSDFTLTKATGVSIFGIYLGLPDLFAKKAPIELKTQIFNAVNEKLNSEAPLFTLPTTGDIDFDLSQARGNAFVLTFVNTWSPPALEQIAVTDELITDESFASRLVINQETPSKVKVFAKKGNYQRDFIVDRDGVLVDAYSLSSLPMHYFLDRFGVVKKIVTGVLNADELKSIFEEVSIGN